MAKSTFTEKLRKYRKNADLTQGDLARLCGCAQGHISNLERGAIDPSMKMLKDLSSVFGIRPADLLAPDTGAMEPGAEGTGIPVINENARSQLTAPTIHGVRIVGTSSSVLCIPGVRQADAFAVHLPDDSMWPEFGKGDLVVFSLAREPRDGDACLIETAKGRVIFRTVLSLGGGRWRLQPANAKFAPETIRLGRAVRMWPAIGRWQMLLPRRRG